MPGLKCGSECGLVDMCEREGDGPEISSGFGLRPPSQVLGHLIQLVELADLYRNVVENVEETPSTINHDGLKFPTLLFEDQAAIAIVGHTLSGDFVPPDILLQFRRTKYADAIVPPPEGGVGDNDSLLRNCFWSRYDDRIELFPYPYMRSFVFLC